MTLRLRLALVYGSLASFALFSALVAAYGFYERGAYRSVDSFSQVFTRQAIGMMGLNSGIDPLSMLPLGTPVQLRLFAADGRLLSAPSDAPLTPLGAALEAETPAYDAWISLLPSIGANRSVYRGFSLAVQNGARWRVYTVRDPQGRYVQALTSLATTDAAVAQIRGNYTLFGSLGALLVFLLGYLISGPALRPLNSLMQGAQTVARSSDPRFRLSKGSGNDELGRLNETFNAMLGSLETSAAGRESALGSEREARIAAENALGLLEQSENRFRRVVESRVVGVMIARRDGTISYANEALLNMLGYEAGGDPMSETSLVGKPWAALTPAEFAARDEAATAELISAAKIVPYEKEYLRADGSTIPVLIGATLLEGAEFEVAAFVLDLTERRRAEETVRVGEAQARALSEAQRRFVSDAAHELRAPLTSIQGNLELMERYPEMPDTERVEAVREAVRESRRLARLAHDMLSLARGDAGLNLELHPLALGTLLNEVWRDARHLARGQTMQLEGIEACVVSGHADRLRQLALVLLDNALNYTPPSGTVRMSLKVEANHALLRISDTGPGIAADQLVRVFERFYRADPSRSRETGGTGLGLSIARWIAEQHGAQIWLESVVGQGTTAVVKFPLLPASALGVNEA